MCGENVGVKLVDMGGRHGVGGLDFSVVGDLDLVLERSSSSISLLLLASNDTYLALAR